MLLKQSVLFTTNFKLYYLGSVYTLKLALRKINWSKQQSIWKPT